MMNSRQSGDFSERMFQVLMSLEKALVFVTNGVLILLTSMIVIDVCLRFFLNKPLPASVESTELMMPYIVFCPLAYTLTKGGHVRISLFVDRMPPGARSVCQVVSVLIGFLLCGMLAYWGWLHFWESFVIREEMLAIIKLPWWVGKFAMPVGFFFMAVRYLFELFFTLIGKPRGL